MAKKIKAFLCALLMLLTLSAPQVGGSASAVSVIYTAMNDSLLELSDETMPFWYGSYLYVPAASVASTGMGVSYVYNTAKQTVVLYTNSETVMFDLAANTAVDQNGKSYPQTCVRRNGRPFVPAAMVAKVLGLSYSYMEVDNGYLVRFCSAAAVLTDGVFADAAESLMESRYKDYIRGEGDSQTGEGNEDVDEEAGSHQLYLSLTVSDAESAMDLAGIAEAYGQTLLFFLTEDLLFDPEAGDAVRRIVCSASGVGLFAPGENAAETLKRCNDRLFSVAGCKTRLVYVDEEQQGAAEDAGYHPFRADIVRSGDFASASANGVLESVSARNRAVKVYLGQSVQEDGLRALLGGVRSREYTVLRFTEVTA